jgi:hypothetical protein
MDMKTCVAGSAFNFGSHLNLNPEEHNAAHSGVACERVEYRWKAAG